MLVVRLFSIAGRRRRTVWGLASCALFAGSLLFTAAHPGAQDCEPDAKLVNPCRPWLGVATEDYPQQPSGLRTQIEYHEQRIGHNVDVVHSYHSPTESVPLSNDTKGNSERYFVNRANTYMFINWKPAVPWSNAGGGNATVNAKIDQAADNIASVAPHKVFLTLHHEPENDVTGGATGCSADTYKPDAGGGTVQQYRAMWQNVRSRFNAKGVTNVVWVLDYMNYNRWDCLIDDLYPGNAYVDWVMFNAYGSPSSPSFVTNVSRFQTLLTNLNTSSLDFLSKPWGIVEWNFYKTLGSAYVDPQVAYDYYDAAREAVEDNTFPRLKAFMVFDAVGTGNNEHRIGYDVNNDPTAPANQQVLDPQRTAGYVAFAESVLDAGTPDTTEPVVTITTPSWDATVSGTITIAATATDNVGVTRVDFVIDDTVIGTDYDAPYSMSWNTATVPNGEHRVRAKGYDAAGNAKTPNVRVNVQN